MKAKGYSTIAGLEKLTPQEIKKRNIELYGSKVKKYRKRAGLTAQQLADILQITRSSVQNWECGITRPDPEFLFRMFSILNVEPNEFFGIGGIGTILTDEERELLDNYRSLDSIGKQHLEAIAETLSEQAHSVLMKNAYDSMTLISNYGRLAAAGSGAEWEDYPEEDKVLLLNNYAVSQADEIITVSGESMEPQFHNGDLVLVEYCDEIRNGDIGIFFASGYGAVIKQVAYDRLHSLNKEYDDIYPYEEGAKLIGRVLCKITPDMIPTPEQVNLYNEAVETFDIEG